MTQTIGVDLGATKILGVVLDADGSVPVERRIAIPPDGQGLVDVTADLVGALSAECPAVEALGVGVAGLVTRDGVVRYSPNIPALRETPLATELAERTHLPVVLDNDSNTAAWGELMHGAAANARNALVVTIGTGVGGGIIVDGVVLRGAHGFAAEIGHFTVDPNGPRCACGEAGHWEAIASGTALGMLARERAEAGTAPSILARAGGDVGVVSGHHVTEAAQAGADDALALLREFADRIAVGLAGLANILDPELIVVAGGLVTAAGNLLLEPLQRKVAHHIEAPDHRPPIPVLAAALGDRSGAIGAADLARSREVP